MKHQARGRVGMHAETGNGHAISDRCLEAQFHQATSPGLPQRPRRSGPRFVARSLMKAGPGRLNPCARDLVRNSLPARRLPRTIGGEATPAKSLFVTVCYKPPRDDYLKKNNMLHLTAE